ncbi:MAG: DUF2085 domain-containing protein [Anaerolineae bacterium]|nr:DUF2085 domain-containing protein [Anaerolineae bacterium]
MSVQNDPQQPSTAEILAEVERRRSEASHQKSEGRRRIVIFLDRCVFWLSKHWLAVVNILAFLYVGLPVLSAVLLYLGAEGPGGVIQSLYGPPICHQLPQRSWFLLGQKLSYRLPELLDYFNIEPHPKQWQDVEAVYRIVRYGNSDLGFKIALCQRDVAIYGTIMLAGLAYAQLRHLVKIRPIPLWIYFAFGIVPIGMDGGYQWVTYTLDILLTNSPIPVHETTPLLRTLTGALFGLATAWLAYPHVQDAMDDFRKTLQKRFEWE